MTTLGTLVSIPDLRATILVSVCCLRDLDFWEVYAHRSQTRSTSTSVALSSSLLPIIM